MTNQKFDPQILWTYLIHDAANAQPSSSVFAFREDALGAAERDWAENCERLSEGKVTPPLCLLWEIVPTDHDLTVATPRDGVTVMVYPMRLETAAPR